MCTIYIKCRNISVLFVRTKGTGCNTRITDLFARFFEGSNKSYISGNVHNYKVSILQSTFDPSTAIVVIPNIGRCL